MLQHNNLNNIADLLKKTRKSRIVIVSSELHWFGGVSLKNPNPVDETAQWKLYRNTKFANNLFSNELARRLKETGKVTEYSFLNILIIVQERNLILDNYCCNLLTLC